MYGPRAKGFWTGSGGRGGHTFLVEGTRYRVVRAFADFDGHEHPVGETWFFAGSNYLPYDEGLSLFVSLDGTDEWHIRMQWTPEQQGPIVDRLSEYVAACEAE